MENTKDQYMLTIVFYLFNGSTITQSLVRLNKANKLNQKVAEHNLIALKQLLEAQGYITLKEKGVFGKRYKLFAEEIEYIDIFFMPLEEG